MNRAPSCRLCAGRVAEPWDANYPWVCSECGARIQGPVLYPTVTDEHRRDVQQHGRETFLATDRSIRLYHKLGITEPWNEWEWPRRLAAQEDNDGTQPHDHARPTGDTDGSDDGSSRLAAETQGTLF